MKFTVRFWAKLTAVACVAMVVGAPALAAPIVPTSDSEVIDTLPAISGSRIEARRLRKQLMSNPRDAALALSAAKQYLDQAHSSGDPRFAGMAMSAIAGWSDTPATPDNILVMRASIQQYLHQFDTAVTTLKQVLSRPSRDSRAQVWLMLATIRRVQGRYTESDQACNQVARAGAAVYATACLAENAALRGDVDRSRATFARLIAQNANAPEVQAWLMTSVAELEQRADKPKAAEAAFEAALRLDPDPYTKIDFADFLIDQNEPAKALELLRGQPRTDAILLRLSIAGALAGTKDAQADAAEMRDRIALANERPDTSIFHGREQAMFALRVESDPHRAFKLAQGDVTQQREPLDILVLAQSARATGDPAAAAEVKRVMREMGLVDRRVDALL